MTDAALRLVDEVDVASETSEPTVFTRSITTPAGAPWDQARAAALDARLGAPLPLSEVVYRIWRLGAWNFGRPARYAVCYVRAREIGDRFDTTVLVDGRTIRVLLFSKAERRRRARVLTIAMACAAAAVLIILGAVVQALSTRSAAELGLSSAERSAAVRLRQAQSLARLKDQTRWLDAAHVGGQTVDDFLGDLAWASANKAPGAHIDAVHWEHGIMGVEVRGSTPPFGQSSRSIIKVDKPLRPGVWLWGVGPQVQGQPSSASQPLPNAGDKP